MDLPRQHRSSIHSAPVTTVRMHEISSPPGTLANARLRESPYAARQVVLATCRYSECLAS
jgi:hypothetical protein